MKENKAMKQLRHHLVLPSNCFFGIDQAYRCLSIRLKVCFCVLAHCTYQSVDCGKRSANDPLPDPPINIYIKNK